MKMSLGKRIVLLAHWLLSVIACLMAVFFCVWPDTIRKGFEFLYSLIGKRSADIVGGIFLTVYVILAALSIVLLLNRKQKDDESGLITVVSDESGKTRIAVGAIDQMIRIAVRSVDGIADMKTAITNEMDAISISVNVAVISGVHIPTVTANIQRTIRNYIELNCGVAVREVCVSVSALETPEEAGKRGRRKFGKSAAASAPAAIEDVPAAVEEIRGFEAEISPEPAEEISFDAAEPVAEDNQEV